MQRNQCACYLEMGDYSKVELPLLALHVSPRDASLSPMAVQLALQNDPDSVHSHFLAYKVAVMEGALDKGQCPCWFLVDTKSQYKKRLLC